MKCLLIVIMILINGIESAEQQQQQQQQRTRQSDTVLGHGDLDLDDRTKSWLLMVESGKVDEENIRKITPKSVFIAPLLESRSGKCKEGYRHNHLGECVKVIQIDPNAQLQALLAKLNAMYAEKKLEEEEEEEQQLSEISNEPLHFSLPISDADTTSREGIEKSSESNDVPEIIPVPLPMVSSSNETAETNDTKELEGSGFGDSNKTDVIEGSGFGSTDLFAGSGSGSGESPLEETTHIMNFMSDEFDYTDATETTTTEIPTESYQSVTSVPDENNESENETVKNETKSNLVRFPSENSEIERTRVEESIPQEYIRFPDQQHQPHQNYQQQTYQQQQQQQQQQQSQSYQQQPSQSYQHPYSAIPREQFWWLPENWKIDERQHKPTLVKFWSRLPLVHDPTFVKDDFAEFRKAFAPSQSNNEYFRPSTRIDESYHSRPPISYSGHRRGRFFGS